LRISADGVRVDGETSERKTEEHRGKNGDMKKVEGVTEENS
jgi:hypothetical protein